jgi:anti-sigma factor ChrR (cupin superfamily)
MTARPDLSQMTDEEIDALFDADGNLRALEQALGAGTGPELVARDVAWQSAFDALEARLDEVAPSPEVWARIERSVEDLVNSETTLTVHAAEKPWEFVAPGVEKKLLHLDAEAGWQAMILKLEPGAFIPPHSHDLAEECLILEGDLEVDGVRARAGDFHLAFANADHSPVFSPSGATLYIRGGLAHMA